MEFPSRAINWGSVSLCLKSCGNPISARASRWFILRSICLFQKRPERVMHGQILLALGKVRSGNAVATNTASGGVRSNKACTGGVMLPSFVSWRSMNKFAELEALEDYEVHHQILNSKDFRVPHNRERIFFVGLRKDAVVKPFAFPAPQPTHLNLKEVFDLRPLTFSRTKHFGVRALM